MAVVKRRKAKPLLIIIIVVALMLLFAGIMWSYLVSPVNKKSDAEIEVIIPSGTTTKQIGVILKNKNLIRNELVFNIYIKLNNTKPLKASTYTMSKNMSLSKIVEVLEDGNSYNPDVIKITFKEGERITDYSKDIAEKTNHTYEEVIGVMTNRNYIQTLVEKYWFLTANILDTNIYYPLEGYLAPNTYNFENKDVTVETIIETMLKQTGQNLKKYRSKIKDNVHYYITMASIVELEGTNTENRKQIVGVFENRLASNMNLGSDVTTYYALQHPMTSDLTAAQFATVNPYNTRSTTMMGKMPIGPICNPSDSSIEASVNSTKNNYYYFVADKYGKIYFTSTNAEHVAKVREIKEKGDWIW